MSNGGPPLSTDYSNSRYIICGKSLLSEGLAESLRALEGVEVFLVNPHLPAAADRIAALEPDVVILERDSGVADLALALLAPGLTLVELDAAQGTVTALTGRQVPITQVGEWVQNIERIAGARS